jgi:hypothetical protein
VSSYSEPYINSNSTHVAKKYPCRSTHVDKIRRIGSCNVGKKAIEQLALSKYKINGKGITFTDLLTNGLASSKNSAKDSLKYHRERGILFTLGNFRPQQYYPKSIESEVRKGKSCKSTHVAATGGSNISHDIKANSLHEVLNSLQWFPLYIHKIQLELHVSPWELDGDVLIECYPRDGYLIEDIGKAKVKYKVHANGTIQVYVACSSHPFCIETDDDIDTLFTVLGQVRDRLLYHLKDPHERFTPAISEWQLTEFDINKDIPITDDYTDHLIPMLPLKVAGRVFRLYVKSMNGVAVCRAEESVTMCNTPLGLALRSLRHN